MVCTGSPEITSEQTMLKCLNVDEKTGHMQAIEKVANVCRSRIGVKQDIGKA
jgi:hypothetical protein